MNTIGSMANKTVLSFRVVIFEPEINISHELWTHEATFLRFRVRGSPRQMKIFLNDGRKAYRLSQPDLNSDDG
jgi:hypothetical protein